MPALANIYCHGVPSGLTLTGEMYPDGSDTAAAGGTGLTVTEQTNRKGSYVVNAGVAGLHLIVLKSGTDVVAQKWSPSNLAITGDFEAFNTREAALIYADTNELQIDWTDGGRLDLLIDAILDDTGTSGVVLSAAQMNKIADHVRRRTQANVEASSDGDALSIGSEYGFIQQAQESNTTDNAGKLTIYKTDGTTELAQKTLASDAAAEPITGIE